MRRAAFLILVPAIALASVASGPLAVLAQPRRPPRPPKADAGGNDNPYDDKPSAASDGGAAPATTTNAPSTDGGLVGPMPRPDLGDGGKLSPLNPQANEFPDGGAPPASIDYDKLLADIAALRARVAEVGDNLFHSRLAVSVETNGDHARIARLTLSLDDGVVFTAPQGFRADDARTVYEHSVAPGRHALAVDVERRDDRDDSFRTSQRSRVTVDVPRDNVLAVEVKIWDDSNMGGDFPGDKKGRYDLRVRVKAQAKPLGR